MSDQRPIKTIPEMSESSDTQDDDLLVQYTESLATEQKTPFSSFVSRIKAKITGTGPTNVPTNAQAQMLRIADITGFYQLDGEYDGQQLSLEGWHPSSSEGHGIFAWDSSKDKSDHDGGNIIDPDIQFSGSVPDYLNASGTGTGAWVRLWHGPVNAYNFGVSSAISNNAIALEFIYDNYRDLSLQNSVDEIVTTEEPIRVRSGSYYRGNGQKITRQANNIVEYASLKKTNNTTVTITNPQRPTQVVDCLLWCNGQWEDGNYMQKFVIEQASFRSSAPSVSSVGLYTIQGGNWTMRNVDWFDFAYAIDGYEVWSCVMEKVVTNGKVRFREGTSIAINQCASGGTGNGGTTGGGFEFDQIRYSSIRASSSDGTNNTAYKFTNCFQFHVDACGSEFAESTGNDLGNCIDFATGNQMTITNFYGVCNEDPFRPAFSVGSGNKLNFQQGKVIDYDGAAQVFTNYDFAITGNNSYVEIHQMQFIDGSYDNPKIRFSSGITNSIVVVYGTSTNDRRPTVFYSDGTGATLSKKGFFEYISNANGSAIKFDDGTLICWHVLPKTDFLNPGASSFTTAQGINWYRSNVKNWIYPEPFLNATSAHVSITPRMGSGGTRLAWPRYSNTGETNAQTGQIQLIGVEDWVAAGQAYIDLIDVQVTAVGRWK